MTKENEDIALSSCYLKNPCWASHADPRGCLYLCSTGKDSHSVCSENGGDLPYL